MFKITKLEAPKVNLTDLQHLSDRGDTAANATLYEVQHGRVDGTDPADLYDSYNGFRRAMSTEDLRRTINKRSRENRDAALEIVEERRWTYKIIPKTERK